MIELKESMESATERWAEDQERLEATQLRFEEEGQRIGREYHDLVAVADQLRYISCST